jgi:Protein of unknown function (DUF2785)
VKWAGVVLILVLMQQAMSAESFWGAASPSERAHDREFWRAIAHHDYAVPEGQAIVPLLGELSGYLGSKDPELRDEIAYTIIDQWVRHQKDVPVEALNSLADEWRANLRVGIGEVGTDSVFKRAFSALCLASLAKRDLKQPFLGEERYRGLLTDALTYLKDERDLRGFDPVLGWIHATAHTGDLLAALAANALLRTEDQGRVLAGIAARLASAGEIFTYGEQDRLALVVATIVERKDFDAPRFERWLAAFNAADQGVWKDSPPKIELLQNFENDTSMLRGLAVYLCASPANSGAAGARDAVVKDLQWR